MIVGFTLIGTMIASLSAVAVGMATGSITQALLAYSGTGLTAVLLLCLAATMRARDCRTD